MTEDKNVEEYCPECRETKTIIHEHPHGNEEGIKVRYHGICKTCGCEWELFEMYKLQILRHGKKGKTLGTNVSKGKKESNSQTA